MGKLANIKSNIVNLAKAPAPEINNEIGTSANGRLPSMFDEEYVDMSKVQVEDYKEMLDSDGTIQALYNSIVMPLLGSNWTIEPDEDNPEAIKQSEWVEDALRKPPHKGGMSTPFDLVIAQALRAVVEGYAGFEKVYTISDEGKIVFKKIAWRDPTTLTMRTDDRGGFNGLRQRAFIGNEYMDVKIPLERCWLYTFGKEWHNVKGRSMFTPAYAAYDKKRRLQYLAEQQAQSDALKLKIVKGKEGANQIELNDTRDVVDEVGFKATVVLPFGYDVDTLNNGDGMDLLPLIEFQNAEMARSVLAMFILLGTGQSSSGSWALSTDQSDFFIQALMAIRKSLENHVTSYLIPDLYNFNFATPQYGTFKFEDITDSTMELLKQSFIKIVEKDHLPDSVIEGIVQKIADKLEIDVDLMAEAEEREKQLEENPPPPQPQLPPPEDPTMPEQTPPVENAMPDPSSVELPGVWKRELTAAEKKVNFAGIENKMNTLEAETMQTIKPIWDALIEDATIKIGRLIESGDYDKIVEANVFDAAIKSQYVKALKESGLDAYIYGKNGASDEIQRKAPTTPKESKDYFRDTSASIAEKQLSDLIFRVQAEVNKSRRTDQLSVTQLSVSDILMVVGEIFASFYSNEIGLTAIAAVSVGINKGRQDVFDSFADEIYAYQYSAILDQNTCQTCRGLDGKVLNYAAYKSTSYKPPIHFSCRCLFVAIMNDELDPPPITGFDEVGLLEPSLSQATQEQIIELGKRAVQDEVLRLSTEE